MDSRWTAVQGLCCRCQILTSGVVSSAPGGSGSRWLPFSLDSHKKDGGVEGDSDDVRAALLPRFSRSSGLVDQIFFRRAMGKSATAGDVFCVSLSMVSAERTGVRACRS